jgi:hypothetical protein
LSNLTPPEKVEFLPPGYSGKNPNPQAVQMVDKITRESIKSEKGILRGCVSFFLKYCSNLPYLTLCIELCCVFVLVDEKCCDQ